MFSLKNRLLVQENVTDSLFYGFRQDIFNSLFTFVPPPAFVTAELSINNLFY